MAKSEAAAKDQWPCEGSALRMRRQGVGRGLQHLAGIAILKTFAEDAICQYGLLPECWWQPEEPASVACSVSAHSYPTERLCQT